MPTRPDPNVPHELSVRERRFIDGLARGQSAREAAANAGWSPARAATTGSEKLASVNIRQALRARLEEIGLDDSGLAAKLRDLIDARKTGLTMAGSVVDMGPDPHASAKGLDMVLKVAGAYPDPRVELDVTQTVLVLRPDDMLAPAGDAWGPVIDVTPVYKDAEPTEATSPVARHGPRECEDGS